MLRRAVAFTKSQRLEGHCAAAAACCRDFARYVSWLPVFFNKHVLQQGMACMAQELRAVLLGLSRCQQARGGVPGAAASLGSPCSLFLLTCCMPWPLHDVPHRACCWRPAALISLHAEVILYSKLLVLGSGIVQAATAQANRGHGGQVENV
jgi:hypothetical protein